MVSFETFMNGAPRVSVERDERFQEALDVGSCPNEPEEPFKTKYESRRLLKILRSEYEKKQSTATADNSSEESDLELSLSLIDYKLGCNFAETEELSEGEKLILSSKEVFQKHTELFHVELLECANQLGILWSGRGEPDASRQHLEEALELYNSWKSIHDQGDSVIRERLESLHTHTLFYLAQVCAHLKDVKRAARFCREVLYRQLHSKEFNALDWAINCVKLSAFYIHESQLRQAIYCVDAAAKICPQQPPSEELETLKADIECAYGEIYAQQLRRSREALMQSSSSPAVEGASESLVATLDQSLEVFPGLEVPDPPPLLFIGDLASAQSVFKTASASINKALAFYKLDGFVSDHVVLLQKLSGMLKDVSEFDSNPANICKFQKRRINLLEHLLGELNPQIYTDFYRQISHEVGEAYAEMVSQKTAQLETVQGREREQRSQKINSLAVKAIANLRLFVASLESGQDGSVDEAYHLNYLNARFQIARMFAKMFAANKSGEEALLKHSLEEYEKIVSFASSKHVKDFAEELAICTEMATLLPLKIRSISA